MVLLRVRPILLVLFSVAAAGGESEQETSIDAKGKNLKKFKAIIAAGASILAIAGSKLLTAASAESFACACIHGLLHQNL
jgi:hypothetical protein